MTLEQAVQLLSKSSSAIERDPLDGPREVDPLDHVEERDPLGGAPEPAAASEEAPAEAADTPAPEAPAPEEEPTAETEAEAEVQPTVKTEADGRKRVNIFRKNPDGTFVYSEITRRALVMADEEGIDVLDALKALGVSQLTEGKPAAEAAAPAAPEKTSAQIDAEITALKTQRGEARKKYAESFDDADKAIAEAASDQIEDLLGQRSDAVQREVQRRESQRHAQTAFEASIGESEGRAADIYPDALKEGTPLFLGIQAEVQRLAALKSPLLNDPDYPETIAAKVANRLRITPKVAPAAKPTAPATQPAKPTAAAVAPKRAALPIPAPGAVSSAPPVVNKAAEISAQIKAASARNDIKELNRLMEVATKLAAA